MPKITWPHAHSLRPGEWAHSLTVSHLPDEAKLASSALFVRAHGLANALKLCRAFRDRRNQRQTLRELAHLIDRLLRDIGAVWSDTKQRWFADKCRHALALLDDNDLIHLSEFGREQRRQARHGGSSEPHW